MVGDRRHKSADEAVSLIFCRLDLGINAFGVLCLKTQKSHAVLHEKDRVSQRSKCVSGASLTSSVQVCRRCVRRRSP